MVLQLDLVHMVDTAQPQLLVLVVQVKQIIVISRTSLLVMKACKCIPLHPWSITNTQRHKVMVLSRYVMFKDKGSCV